MPSSFAKAVANAGLRRGRAPALCSGRASAVCVCGPCRLVMLTRRRSRARPIVALSCSTPRFNVKRVVCPSKRSRRCLACDGSRGCILSRGFGSSGPRLITSRLARGSTGKIR